MRLLHLASLALLAACSPATEERAEHHGPEQVSASDLIYCDDVEQETTLRDCELAGLARAQSAKGLATLNYSRFMTVGEASSVRLVIDRQAAAQPVASSDAPAEQEPSPAGGVGSDGQNSQAPDRETPSQEPESEPEVTETYHPIIGRFTSVRLEGTDFEISPREAVTKEIPREGQAGWDWTLTPRREGTLTFLVVTNVQFRRTDGTYLALAQKAEPYTVKVGVGIFSRIRVALDAAPAWIKALTAILVALTGLVGAWFALRKVIRNRGAPPSSPDDSVGD
ncbi:MAG: hypothetical protein EON85_04720 [Brevundimonas sp.]|nr:MAG: hypothetical protein EON85_04720 [Brevundimonas sp.]